MSRMPRRRRTTAEPIALYHEPPVLAALAYADAVRDILAADGRFHLADGERHDAVWEWDGVRWTRLPLVDRPIGRAQENPPFADVESDDDLAVAS